MGGCVGGGSMTARIVFVGLDNAGMSLQKRGITK